MRRFILLIILCHILGGSLSQSFASVSDQLNIELTDTVSFSQPDIISVEEEVSVEDNSYPLYPRTIKNPYTFRATDLIAPVSLIGIGSLGFTGWWKNHINRPVMEDLQRNGHKPIGIDNYMMFIPAVAGYGMNLFGFKGMHDVVDATIIYATAYLLLEVTTISVKHIVYSPRPNGKNNMSFPSGHTAIAFCGAELLRREYWNVSPWIGIGGYLVAGATGFMRLYNNAHWFNDIIAGAGFGILCAQAAYWLYPLISKAFFKKRYNANVWLAPSVSKDQLGLGAVIEF